MVTFVAVYIVDRGNGVNATVDDRLTMIPPFL